MQIKETTMRPVGLLIPDKNEQNVVAYLSFFILIYETIFSDIKTNNILTFLKT